MKSYTELQKLDSFLERYRYLRLKGKVGEETFGHDRYLNQLFYTSYEWRQLRNEIILRDNGCDLGCEDRPIKGKVLIHHMNPITEKDIYLRSEILMNPEYLICVSYNTHNALHYGDETLLISDPIVRTPNDTCPWRK